MKKYIWVKVCLLGWLTLMTTTCGDEPKPEAECHTTADCLDLLTNLGACEYARCDSGTQTCQVEVHTDYHHCEDGHPCTENDYCLSGECLAGSLPDCADGLDCTVDTCDEVLGCSHQADDGLCDDDEPCTDDYCDAMQGCIHAVNQAIPGCQVCSYDEDCDDTLQCTDDFCNPDLNLCQVVNSPDGTECDDGNPCTAPDTCQAGSCQPGADICAKEVCDNEIDDDGDDLTDCEDDDCRDDPVCEPCDDDGMEDNDTEATAASIGPGRFFGLTACPLDSDYYQLELNAGDTLEVTLDFVHAEGDINLRILDPALGVLAESTSQDDGEYLQIVAEDSGAHLIKIVLFEELGVILGNQYDMDVSVEQTTPTCMDDGFENNDGFAQAVLVSQGAYTNLHSCPGDQDFFAFSAGVGDQINLAVIFANQEGDIDLHLLNPAGAIVATSTTTTDNETLAFTVVSAGNHVAKVWLDSDGGGVVGNIYELHITVEEATPTCIDDGFEDNDGYSSAMALGEGIYLNLRTCPGDGDYYATALGVGDEISVELAFAHSEGDIQLHLLNPQGWLVAASESASDNESLTYTATSAGRHVIAAWLNTDAGVEPGNDYGMSIAVQEATPVCPDDGFEDNDEIAEAVALGEGSFAGLRVCPGDDDYFAVALAVGEEITVDLTFAHAIGDVDLQLTNPNGAVVATSTTSTDDEVLSYTAEKAGVHVVRVWLSQEVGGENGNDYSMSIAVEESLPTCADDGLEDNDTQATAVAINPGVYPGLRGCAGDDDYYALTLGVGDEITVGLAFSDAEGDLDLQLLDPSGTVVASSNTGTDDEALSFTAVKSGTHRVRVWLYLDAGVAEGNDYDMTVDVDEAVPTCTADGFEDNDDFATAAGIAEGVFSDLMACPGDEDYYAVILGVEDEITVRLSFQDSEGDIDLQLLNPAGTVVASSMTTSDDESLTHQATVAGVFRIRVWLYGDDGLIPGNGYDLDVAIEEAIPSCAEDGFEDNDSFALAAPVSQGSYAGLRACQGDEDFFAVDLGVDDEISVYVTFVDEEGDIDLQLLDPSGAVVASATSTTDNETVSHTAASAGRYVIRAWLYSDAGAALGNDYDMVITIEEPVPICSDDGFENNDTFASAAVITEGSYPGLRSCPGDADYFSVFLGVDDQISVDLAFLDAEGDIDLLLLNPAGLVVASSSSGTDDESLIHTSASAGNYRIRVWLYADAGAAPGNSYDMSVVVEEAVPVCSDDGMEDNDTPATALDLTEGSYPALRSCSGDQDFYAVSLGAGDELTVDLVFSDAQGDIDLQLLNPQGVVVASSISFTDNESLTYLAGQAGVYTIRVWLFSDAGANPGNDYDMVITVEEYVPVCAEDGFEDNDMFDGAAEVVEGSYAALRSCEGDDDFFKIALAQGDEITVDLAFLHAEGDVELQLLDENQVELASSTTTTDNESLTHTATTSGWYVIRAWLYADSGSVLGNDYDMIVTVEEYIPTCTEDSFEDNDSFGAAVQVGPGTYQGLRACDGDDDFFAFAADLGEEIAVDLSFLNAEGDIDVYLLDENQVEVASSTTSTDDESLFHIAAASGWYVARVTLYSDSGAALGNDYDLSVAVEVPVCAEDGYEDNDTPATATELDQGSYPGLRVCEGDYDNYAVDLLYHEQVTVNLSFVHAEGDIEMQLLDDNGYPVAVSSSSTDDESLTYSTIAAGRYTIRVWLESDTGTVLGNDYDLDISIQAGTTCTDDLFEENDSFANAAPVTVGWYYSLRICKDEDDQYAINLTNGQQIKVDLFFSDVEADIDLELFNPSGTRVAYSNSSTDNESITYTATQTGAYRIRVWIYGSTDPDLGNVYDMNIQTL